MENPENQTKPNQTKNTDEGNGTAWVSVLGYARLFAAAAAHTPGLYLVVRGKFQLSVESAQVCLGDNKRQQRSVQGLGSFILLSHVFYRKSLACRG